MRRRRIITIEKKKDKKDEEDTEQTTHIIIGRKSRRATQIIQNTNINKQNIKQEAIRINKNHSEFIGNK